jgi:ClpP class serine protease
MSTIFLPRNERSALSCSDDMERHSTGQTRVGYIAFLCSESVGASIDSSDIPGIGDALLSVGEVDQLNLIINGPGGDGTVAEKIIELCRSHCSEFRVVVPNRAKSAAIIIALGADEIVMGYCSELGPIDAQVPIVVGGIPRYISAQSFIDSKASLQAEFHKAIKAKEDPRAVLQQIVGEGTHQRAIIEVSRFAEKVKNSGN